MNRTQQPRSVLRCGGLATSGSLETDMRNIVRTRVPLRVHRLRYTREMAVSTRCLLSTLTRLSRRDKIKIKKQPSYHDVRFKKIIAVTNLTVGRWRKRWILSAVIKWFSADIYSRCLPVKYVTCYLCFSTLVTAIRPCGLYHVINPIG